MKREIDNLVVILTPWEMRIKKIESKFGVFLIFFSKVIKLPLQRSIRISRRLLLHVLAMDILDKYVHRHRLRGLHHGAGSEYFMSPHQQLV